MAVNLTLSMVVGMLLRAKDVSWKTISLVASVWAALAFVYYLFAGIGDGGTALTAAGSAIMVLMLTFLGAGIWELIEWFEKQIK